MSPETARLIALLLIALCLSGLVILLTRRQMINFRYSIGWLLICVLTGLAGLSLPIVKPIASGLQIADFTLVGVAAILVLLLICIQLSVSISGLQQQILRLAEEAAILRCELETREIVND